MNLSIQVRHIDHIAIIELSGRLSVLETPLKQVVEALLERGDQYFIVNLAKLSYLDNSGLGQLCSMYTVARENGGDMKLLKPTPRIKELLKVTKLDTIFESFEREADAIGSMFSYSNCCSMSASGF
jgi:anti-sigma B factor antagonist